MAVGYRPRASLPRLGASTPVGDLLLDTNAIINALAGRGPPELKALFANLHTAYVSGPTLAELSWLKGRLDPGHPDTARVLKRLEEALERVDPAKVLNPSAEQWARAGELAGKAARMVAGGGKSIRTAFERIELINDAATAIVALDLGLTVMTQDADFDLLLQITQRLSVLFYD
jgi:predicted nucleic acid-binding protein